MPPALAYDTGVLVAVVQDLKFPRSALLDRYFPTTVTFDTEAVLVEVEKGKRRVAPYVSPLVPAAVKDRQARRVNSFQPAYIKEKVAFDPHTAVTRAPGEPIGGGWTGQERMDRALVAELEALIRGVVRRLEVSAAEALRLGKVVITGEGYPSVTVDFDRAPTLTPTALAGTARWSETTAQPLKNLRTWATLVRKESGVNPTDVIMGDDAFEHFLDNGAVQKRLDINRIAGNTITPGVEAAEGLTFQGVIDRYNVFTYSGWYVDPADGVEKEIWPKNWVGMTAPGEFGVAGRRLFGMVRDKAAGYRPMPFFPKMWLDQDPAVEWLMVQSAPLIVPFRPDASLAVQVHD